MTHDTPLKNLIFDLGGVILDLSVDHTLQSFSALAGIPVDQVKSLFISSQGFMDYEKGLITDDAFRAFVRDLYNIHADDAALDACWNAMLRGIPQHKLDLLSSLKAKYNVYLLSNTNDIHLHYINEKIMLPLTGQNSLEPYFHKAYFSQRMKMRKPDAEIFEQVLRENNLRPAETLFLDDNADNIAGAKSLGIQTVHVLHPDQVTEYFHVQRN